MGAAQECGGMRAFVRDNYTYQSSTVGRGSLGAGPQTGGRCARCLGRWWWTERDAVRPREGATASATLPLSAGAVLRQEMSTYTIIPRPDQSGYDIAIIGTDGARQTMLGFETKVEAEAWIAQDERLSGSVAPPG
jgi:hypothetical protein